MDFFNDDDLDARAAILGGAIGFAEESLQIENEAFKENDEELEIDDSTLPFNLRVFKEEYPKMFKEVVKSVNKYHEYRAKIKETQVEILNNEFYYELEEMEKSEHGG